MLTQEQLDQMAEKLRRFQRMLEPKLFCYLDSIRTVDHFETSDSFDDVPPEALYTKDDSAFSWGEEYGYCWVKTCYIVPEEFAGRDLFLIPHMG